jgi:DNA-directed RNA polymerase subunit N (RpoN/RPB10)
METHEIRCHGCGKHVSTMTLWRPRLPWWDDRFCSTCGNNPAVNVKPSPMLRRWVLEQLRYWKSILGDLGMKREERRIAA